MGRLLMALAAGAALATPLHAETPAQESRPGPTQPDAGRQAQGIAPAQLNPDQIRQIQQALKDQGFYRGAVDGVWRAGSAAALRRYRAGRPGQEGITPDRGTEWIDRETLSALGLDPARFGQAEPYAPKGPTGRRGSPPHSSPGAPPSTSPGGPSR